MKFLRGRRAAAVEPEPDTSPGSPDNGPVIVLVEERGSDNDVLEWAAAEAAARGSELRIVHAVDWPPLVDPAGNAPVEREARVAAEAVLTAAVRRARRTASSLRIRTSVFPGGQATALVSEARSVHRALVVLGHTRRSGQLGRRLVRRTTASIAVIGLSAAGAVGLSAGRVVVGVDNNGGPPPALGFAFRAARRRGIGLTVVHATTSNRHSEIEEAVQIWQMAYPDVDVRWSFAPGAVDSLVLAESTGAALTVLGTDRRGRIHRALRGSASYNVLRLARTPVVMVGTTGT